MQRKFLLSLLIFSALIVGSNLLSNAISAESQAGNETFTIWLHSDVQGDFPGGAGGDPDALRDALDDLENNDITWDIAIQTGDIIKPADYTEGAVTNLADYTSYLWTRLDNITYGGRTHNRSDYYYVMGNHDVWSGGEGRVMSDDYGPLWDSSDSYGVVWNPHDIWHPYPIEAENYDGLNDDYPSRSEFWSSGAGNYTFDVGNLRFLVLNNPPPNQRNPDDKIISWINRTVNSTDKMCFLLQHYNMANRTGCRWDSAIEDDRYDSDPDSWVSKYRTILKYNQNFVGWFGGHKHNKPNGIGLWSGLQEYSWSKKKYTVVHEEKTSASDCNAPLAIAHNILHINSASLGTTDSQPDNNSGTTPVFSFFLTFTNNSQDVEIKCRYHRAWTDSETGYPDVSDDSWGPFSVTKQTDADDKTGTVMDEYDGAYDHGMVTSYTYTLPEMFYFNASNEQNQAPTISISHPTADSPLSGIVTVTGSASDPDGSVEKVQASIDDGIWQAVNGTTSWSYHLNTTTLSDGNHIISARSYDNTTYSEIKTVSIIVDNTPPAITDNTSPLAFNNTDFSFTASCNDNTNISKAFVNYSFDSTNSTNKSMAGVENSNYIHTVHLSKVGKIWYNISACDLAGNWNRTVGTVEIKELYAPRFIDGPTLQYNDSSCVITGTANQSDAIVDILLDNTSPLNPPYLFNQTYYSSSLSANLTGLSFDTTYYYQIVLHNGSNHSFTTIKQGSFRTTCATPTIASISNNTGLQWCNITASIANVSNANTSIEWGKNGYENTCWVNNTLSPSFNLTSLSPYTKYQYKIISFNQSNASYYISSHGNFTTLAPPHPNFSYTPTCPNATEKFQFIDTSTDVDGSIVNWTWSFGDQTCSYQQNPQHSYTTHGTYTVSLAVTDNHGIVRTASKNITINSIPTADYTWSPHRPLTASDITFDAAISSDKDGDIALYEWDWNNDGEYDEITTSPTATQSWADNGTYTVLLRVTDALGAHHIKKENITVDNRAPHASFSFSPQRPEPGQTVRFSSTCNDDDGSIEYYQWWFDDGTSSSQQNPAHALSASGTYYVTLEVTDDDGYSSTVTRYVVVNRPPTANFTFSPKSPTDVENISFTDTSEDVDGNIVSYRWDFCDGNTSTDKNPVHRYADNGSYSLFLTVTDDDGATSTKNIDLRVYNVKPEAAFNATPLTPVKIGTPIYFSDLSTDVDGTVTNCSWNFDDGTREYGSQINHTYNESGTYNVTLTVTDDDGATACDTILIKVEKKQDEGIRGFQFILLVAAAFIALTVLRRRR